MCISSDVYWCTWLTNTRKKRENTHVSFYALLSYSKNDKNCSKLKSSASLIMVFAILFCNVCCSLLITCARTNFYHLLLLFIDIHLYTPRLCSSPSPPMFPCYLNEVMTFFLDIFHFFISKQLIFLMSIISIV